MRHQSTQSDSPLFDYDKPIADQLEKIGQISPLMLAKWIEIAAGLLEMGGSLLATSEGALDEKKTEIERLLKKYRSLTPRQFVESIRAAARDKMQQLAQHPERYPRLFAYEIEEALREATAKLLRDNEAMASRLALPANVGGNDFWGEPSEALRREWPRIVEQVKTIRRELGIPNWRSRFWLIGSHDQRQSAVQVLRQMIVEMHEAGKWDLRQNQWEAVAIWANEFREAYPQHLDLIFDAKNSSRLTCPLDHLQIEDIRATIRRRNAEGVNKAEFPERMDAIYSATFDAYWKFKEGGLSLIHI